MEAMSPEDKLQLIEELEQRGLHYNTFWNTLANVFFTDVIPTAAVTYKNDQVQFLFNKEFWNSLPREAQLFVVCHEQLHIILNHMKRLAFQEGDIQLKNVAADVCVNHLLLRGYKFEKTDIPNWERLCWIDTVFPDRVVSDNETAEYYYALLKQQEEQTPLASLPQTLDEHQPDSNESTPSRELQKAIEKAINEGSTAPAVENSEEFEKATHSMSTTGMGTDEQIHDTRRSRNASWKSVFYKVPKRILGERVESQWLTPSRRNHLLGADLMLPNEITLDVESRVKVYVYLDSSGSCIKHAQHFLESALSLPPSLYDFRIFGFGTEVYEVSRTPPYRLVGFGNENYQAVSNHVDSLSPPDAVFVMTDGYSPQATITNPKVWHWFITPNGITTHIDSRCRTYDLLKFGWKG